MDTKIEGYLMAGMALIPTGIGMITAAPETTGKLVGVVVTGLGIACIVLRAHEKDKVETV